MCVCASERVWEGEKKGCVAERSGLTAGCSRDTLNGPAARPTGGEQCTCIGERERGKERTDDLGERRKKKQSERKTPEEMKEQCTERG